MLRIAKNQKGISLIEIMVGLLVLSVITVNILQIFKFFYTTQSSEIANNKVREQYQEMTIMITQDFKKASDVNVTNSPTEDILTLSLYDGKTTTYRYNKTAKEFYYNGGLWFKAVPLTPTTTNVMVYDPVHNTVHFYLALEQLNKPLLPFDLVASPRFKEME